MGIGIGKEGKEGREKRQKWKEEGKLGDMGRGRGGEGRQREGSMKVLKAGFQYAREEGGTRVG